MNRLLILMTLAAPTLLAQEQPKAGPSKPEVQKIFILKYADPRKIQQLLGVFGAQLSTNVDLHALAVTSKAEVMPAIEDAIKRLDVPAAATPNIELTAYYLIGGENESTPGGPVIKELFSVVAQLKDSFPFKTYRLLDVLTVRTRAGQNAETSSSPGPVSPGLPSAVIQFRTGSPNLSADGSTVSLSGLKAGIRLPTPAGPATPGAASPQFTYIDLGLNADVDIKEGQKVVVGRLSVNKDQALFLVLTARVVN